MPPLPDRLPAIFLGRKSAPHCRELSFSEWHSPTATLAWDLDDSRTHAYSASRLWLDLDEAGFGASSNLAGKFYSVTLGERDLLKRRFSVAALILSRADRYQRRIAGPKIAISTNTIAETISPVFIGLFPDHDSATHIKPSTSAAGLCYTSSEQGGDCDEKNLRF